MVIRILRMLALQARTWCRRRSLKATIRPGTELAHQLFVTHQPLVTHQFGRSEIELVGHQSTVDPVRAAVAGGQCNMKVRRLGAVGRRDQLTEVILQYVGHESTWVS